MRLAWLLLAAHARVLREARGAARADLLPSLLTPVRPAVPRAAVVLAESGAGSSPVRAPRRLKGVKQQGRAAASADIQRLSITGGTARGRRIRTPDVFLRPMMSRVREALFSMLTSSGVLRDSAAALDLFAGSGAVGLEALSRGAGRATFVDMSPKCTGAIAENGERLGFHERVQVVEARVDDFLADPVRFGAAVPFDLVTVTPPYEEVVYADLLAQVAASPALGEDTLVVVEYPVELGVLPPTLADGQLVGLRNRRYGRTVLGLYVNRPSGRLDMTPFSEEFVKL